MSSFGQTGLLGSHGSTAAIERFGPMRRPAEDGAPIRQRPRSGVRRAASNIERLERLSYGIQRKFANSGWLAVPATPQRLTNSVANE